MPNILHIAVPITNAALAWPGRQSDIDSLLFINPDLNNTVWIGQLSNIQAAGNGTIPLLPNGTFSGDASSSWYVIGSVAGTQPLVVVPNGQAYFLGLTQGMGDLVIPSMQSPNFAAGLIGWIIRKDGSAEFNNLTIRGTFNGTDFVINSAGQFFYSSTPAANNLIYSVAIAGGTDQFGNVYLAGTTTYHHNIVNGNYWIAVNTNALTTNQNGIVFYTAATEAGPWTAQANIGNDNAGNLFLGATSNIIAGVPVIPFAPSTSTPETWHAATLSGSWANVTGQALQFRLMADNTVEVHGQLVIPAGVTGPSNTIATLPAGYTPATRNEPVTLLENLAASPFTGTAHLGVVRTTGNLDVFGAATAGNTLNVQIRYPLDGT